MDIGHLSPTKLKQAKLCPARLHARLHDDDWDEERGERAALGTLTHTAAEIWYRPDPQWMQVYSTIEDPNHRAQAWESRKIQLADGSIIEKHPMTDPELAFKMAIDRETQTGDMPVDNQSLIEARQLFLNIIDFYKRDVLNVVFAERKYKGGLANGVPVSLKIDLGVDRGAGKLEIVDYKTGFVTIPDDELENEDQVMLNLLAVRRDPVFASFNAVTFSYFWVQHAAPSREVLVADTVLDHYAHALASRYQSLSTMTEPDERINPFCGSCGRRAKCERFKAFISQAMGTLGDDITEEQAMKWDDETLMETSDRLKGQLKVLENSNKLLKEMVKARAQASDTGDLNGTKFRVATRKRQNLTYSPNTVLALCKAHSVDPGDCLSVSKGKAEQVFDGKGNAIDQLKVTSSRPTVTTWIQIEPVKEGGAKKKAKKKASKKKSAKKKTSKKASEKKDESATTEQAATPPSEAAVAAAPPPPPVPASEVPADAPAADATTAAPPTPDVNEAPSVPLPPPPGDEANSLLFPDGEDDGEWEDVPDDEQP